MPLGLISGTSGRGLHGTFAPQTLGIGDTLTATYTFTTPATVGANLGSAFKVAMMDFNNPGLAADLLSQSGAGNENPLYIGLPGYMSDFDVNTATADVSIRNHDVTSLLGRFLGTTSEWIDQSTSSDVGYSFAADTEYVGVFSVTRTGADSVDIFSSISQGATLMDSHTKSDSSAIANNFGMFGIWVNSNTFGSNTTAGDPDNGITFSNIKVEVVTLSTAAPTLAIALSGSDVVLSWPTNGAAGYALESTPSLLSPAWTGAGTPTVVGDQHHVTNAATGGAKYYRLAKP